jgi:hypothetical protein
VGERSGRERGVDELPYYKFRIHHRRDPVSRTLEQKIALRQRQHTRG